MIKYWIIIEGEQRGPITIEELREMNLPGSTPVWREGLTDWTTLERLDELTDRPIEPKVVPPPVPAQEPTIPFPPRVPQPAVGRSVNDGAQAAEAAPTLLGWSVAATLLCCTVLGIVAIVYSIKVRNANERGDYAAGWRAYRTLELWLISAIVLGIVFAPLTMMINMTPPMG